MNRARGSGASRDDLERACAEVELREDGFEVVSPGVVLVEVHGPGAEPHVHDHVFEGRRLRQLLRPTEGIDTAARF